MWHVEEIIWARRTRLSIARRQNENFNERERISKAQKADVKAKTFLSKECVWEVIEMEVTAHLRTNIR